MKQSRAIAILKTGVNVFLTGEPGSGKTYTIQAYVRDLRRHGVEVAVTASTGIAATHVGGMTIHSWSGIGIQKYLSKEDVRDIVKQSRITNRMLKTSVLIIDEISMLDAAVLTAVEKVCRAARKRDEPFGGLQVVFVGDFFQLPPVSREGEAPAAFAFLSDAWKMADPRVCYLTEHHRQEDEAFLDILRGIRAGYLSTEHKERLVARMVDDSFIHAEADVPKLFPHNMNVDRLNEQALGRLMEKKQAFEMKSYGAPPLVDQLKRGCLSPETLVLKRGARVMFTKNSFSEPYANGTLGEIVGFSPETSLPIVKTLRGHEIEVEPTTWSIRAEDRELASIVQLPLRLAWAMTVHKSQGMSLDAAFVDLSQAFIAGQGYVALSRVRSLEGLYLGGLNAQAFEVNREVLISDAEFRRASEEADELLDHLSEEDLAKRHAAFLEESGGSSEPSLQKTPKKKAATKISTRAQTASLVRMSMPPEQIALMRGLKVGTIVDHFSQLLKEGELMRNDLAYLETAYQPPIAEIVEELKKHEGRMKPVFERFAGAVSYDMIRLASIFYEQHT